MSTSGTRVIRIQENGQVTLPVEVRLRLGLKEGDLVAVIETNEGVLLSPQHAVAMKALDRVGTILREQGVDLNEMLDAGRDIRGQLLAEEYGIDADSPAG